MAKVTPAARRAYSLRYNKSPKGQRTRKANRLRVLYGLTHEQYDALLAGQGHKCAICRGPNPKCVDHNHQTNAVRGILCVGCNGFLGWIEKDAVRYANTLTYLDRHGPLL